ncbi:hypothetical protein GCM10008959_05350 [Deinococcus seoulensis]|uniref:Carboxypeptidase regulatory-like domain-containing protein n=1 Tax=Deinococcus seoulensis TaxID=1837379 RepID=A0ABQ2RNG4_9DEIO|nr:carboxypeptidase regulatory-like domain-containing protein [Deinococcus seoulensis]GGR47176.1 hypothetical protein GCM10008959_05350 [Deinococcus seoulensis]
MTAPERMFSGPGPLHPTLSEPLVAQVARVLRWSPQTAALLDFTLPGPDARPVLAALVGPGGIDLLALDPQVAALDASALRGWLAGHGYAAVPVHALTGPPDDTLPGALHASLQDQGGAWHRPDWQPADAARLPGLLNLRPAHLSFVQGRVLSALEGQPVAGVQVWAEADGQQVRTVTDAQGQYAFTAQTGQTVQVGFVPPERYREPDVLRLTPGHAHLHLESVRLPERVSRLGEDDIRTLMMQAMQARLEAKLAQSPDAWTDPTRQLDAIVDDLHDQLRSAQEHVQERQAALAQADDPQTAPLSVRVRHAADRQVLASQHATLDRARHDLRSTHAHPPTSEAEATAQQEAVQRTIDTLTHVTASRSSEQRRTQASLLPLRDAQTTPRTPPALPDITDPLPAAPAAAPTEGPVTELVVAPAAITAPLAHGPVEAQAALAATDTADADTVDAGTAAPDRASLAAATHDPTPPVTPEPVTSGTPAPSLQPAPIQEGPLIIARNADAHPRPRASTRPVVWLAAGALLVAALAATTLNRRAAPEPSTQPSAATTAPTPNMVDPILEPLEPTPAEAPAVVPQPAPGKVTPTVTVTPAPGPAPTPPVPQVTGSAPAPQATPARTPAPPAPRPTTARPATVQPTPARPAPAPAATTPATPRTPIGNTTSTAGVNDAPDSATTDTTADDPTTTPDAVADAATSTIPTSTIPTSTVPTDTPTTEPAAPTEALPPAITPQTIPALPVNRTEPGN